MNVRADAGEKLLIGLAGLKSAPVGDDPEAGVLLGQIARLKIAFAQLCTLPGDGECAAPHDQIENADHEQRCCRNHQPSRLLALAELGGKRVGVLVDLANGYDLPRPASENGRIDFDQMHGQGLLIGTFGADHVLVFGHDLAGCGPRDVR